MIESKESHRPLLIPKWLPSKTKDTDEFNFGKRKVKIDTTEAELKLKISYEEFSINPSITRAADLLHTCIVLNHMDICNKAAKYIVEKGSGPTPLLDFAHRILHETSDMENIKTDSLIATIKFRLADHPNDALLWTDLARCYAIKGQKTKSEKAIRVAMALAPTNRFVSRAAARFFVHTHQEDKAIWFLNRAYKLNPDPMILATLQNCSMIIRENHSSVRRSKLSYIPSNKSRQFSELITTRAIQEMAAGNNRKAKQFFLKGWEDPTENVIAHAEGILRTKFTKLKTPDSLNFERSAEAKTWLRYFKLDLSGAIEMARIWILEEPYSTHPFACGSTIACMAGKCNSAVDIAKEGLIANPGDLLLKNNLAYALLKLNRTDEAREELDSLSSHTLQEKGVVAATNGYYFFKINQPDKGRELYMDAIDNFETSKDFRLVQKAKLCLAIAEVEANTEAKEEAVRKALSDSFDYGDPGIKVLQSKLSDRQKRSTR